MTSEREEELIVSAHPYRWAIEGSICTIDRILRQVAKGKKPDMEDMKAVRFLPAEYDETSGDYNVIAICDGIALNVHFYTFTGEHWHVHITHTSSYFGEIKDCVEGREKRLYEFLVMGETG